MLERTEDGWSCVSGVIFKTFSPHETIPPLFPSILTDSGVLVVIRRSEVTIASSQNRTNPFRGKENIIRNPDPRTQNIYKI